MNTELYHLLPTGEVGRGSYLIFSVMMVIAAKMMVTIQKRIVIFDSCMAPFGLRIR